MRAGRAPSGRIAAHRLGVRGGRPHAFTASRSTSSSRRRSGRRCSARSSGGWRAITDYFLTDGTFVASEAVRLRIAPPERIRAMISPIDAVSRATPAAAPCRPRARSACRRTSGSSGRRRGSLPRRRRSTWCEAIARYPRTFTWSGSVTATSASATRSSIERKGLDDRVPARRRARGRSRSPARVRRLRDVEPVGGPPVRRRRGHDVRDPGRRDGRQLRARDRRLRQDRRPRPARRPCVAGRRARVRARPSRGGGRYGRGRPTT